MPGSERNDGSATDSPSSGSLFTEHFSHVHSSTATLQFPTPQSASFTQMPAIALPPHRAAPRRRAGDDDDGAGSDTETETEGEEAFESCATTPGNPFLSPAITPAITPAPSAPGSTNNLSTFSHFAGATASHLSFPSPLFSLTGQYTPTQDASSIPAQPPAPPNLRAAFQHRSQSVMSVDTNVQRQRESFQAPPKIFRPVFPTAPPTPSRRTTLRQGVPTTLTPPESTSVSSPSLCEKSQAADLFYLPSRAVSPVYKRRGIGSSVLQEGQVLSKPWLERPEKRARIAYWLTYLVSLLGIGASFTRIWFGAKTVQLLEGNLCLVLEDEFNGSNINTDVWAWDVAMDGFGNGEFEMMTNSPNNSFIEDGILYLVPTLTSDVIGTNIPDGFVYNITGCTSTNASACGAVQNSTTETIINPIQSARLTTVNSTSIQYGRVEIRARIPTGDWIWPALWMLPVHDNYGPWPASGEIDIMEARGNDRSYAAQGVNFVRSSLNWGPLSFLNGVSHTFSWWQARRQTFNQEFHTYVLEWSDKFIRASVDSRIRATLDITLNEPFFTRGNFPPTIFNGSTEIPVPDPWGLNTNVAPFDQQFYLIMDVAVGGTNGWFPDNIGNKPWINQSPSAMFDFAHAQDDWYPTWPSDVRDRGMAIDYVKMWQLC